MHKTIVLHIIKKGLISLLLAITKVVNANGKGYISTPLKLITSKD
jgi:hypothetical protein